MRSKDVHSVLVTCCCSSLFPHFHISKKDNIFIYFMGMLEGLNESWNTKVFLNSKALYKCHTFLLTSRLPEAPKLCWFSLHFSSSAIPSKYWPSYKNSRIFPRPLPQQCVTVRTVTSHVADFGPVKLGWTVGGGVPQRYPSEVVHEMPLRTRPRDVFEPLEWDYYVSSVFMKQWFLYLSNLCNKEENVTIHV